MLPCSFLCTTVETLIDWLISSLPENEQKEPFDNPLTIPNIWSVEVSSFLGAWVYSHIYLVNSFIANMFFFLPGQLQGKC